MLIDIIGTIKNGSVLNTVKKLCDSTYPRTNRIPEINQIHFSVFLSVNNSLLKRKTNWINIPTGTRMKSMPIL